MAKKRKSGHSAKRKIIFGILTILFAGFLLVGLISHVGHDDARITGQIDPTEDPFSLRYHNQGGMLGAYLAYFLFTLFGWLSYFLPVGLIFVGLRLLSSKMARFLELHAFLLFLISLLGTLIYNVGCVASDVADPSLDEIGGYISDRLTVLLVNLLGQSGAYISLVGAVLILLITYTSITPLLARVITIPGGAVIKKIYSAIASAFIWLFAFKWIPRKPAIPDEEEPEQPPDDVETDIEIDGDAPQLDLIDGGEELPKRKKGTKTKVALKRVAEPVQIKSFNYTYPNLDLLTTPPEVNATVSAEELNMTARMLQETLETFHVTVEGPIEKYPGPVITRFEFKPGTGIKVNQIISLADDLALALKAKRIRIIAPIPGKAAVGVEIPNRNPQMVFLRDMFESEEYHDPKIRLPLALGKTTAGKPFVADLARMPHLLIAGATGSGKSVCMNALITSLVYRLHPMQVRFIFVDPKMLELSVYSGIPHLGRPVVTKPKQAERVLSDIVVEMENRYRRLATAGVRNIEDFNRKQAAEEAKLPYIIVFVDELADLMMSSANTKTEAMITRLAQMARAVGIHLILATQRPSVDVITGLIKANFPARIAFQVASKVDSRTIIDANGAEKLLGNGDMLFLSSGQPEPQRVHGAYISSEETDGLVAFIKEQGLGMLTLEGISQSAEDAPEGDLDLGDPLFREACEVVIRHKQGSVSLLQRRLGIGYQRAARLIDKLEQAGVVSPFDGSKAREVVVDKTFLETLNAKMPSQTTAD